VLAQNEGFVIRSVLTGPATGSFKLLVTVAYTEVVSYDDAGL